MKSHIKEIINEQVSTYFPNEKLYYIYEKDLIDLIKKVSVGALIDSKFLQEIIELES